MASLADRIGTSQDRIRTVRRNSIEARTMWARATRAVSYTLENYFIGEDVSVDGAQTWFERMATIKPRITSDAPGRYTIRYHSNHWTVLLCPKDASA